IGTSSLDPYVRPYAAAIGNDFILMDDNAQNTHHELGLLRVSGGSVWNEWNGQLDLEPESDRTSCRIILAEGTLNPPQGRYMS
ncbi:hypothetical protein TNCV_3712121, partial [Trichonephila clavipes]